MTTKFFLLTLATTTTTIIPPSQYMKIISPNDIIVGIFNTSTGSSSGVNVGNWVSDESPSSAFDGDINTKYLNYAAGDTSITGGLQSGFYVTPLIGRSIATGIQFATANDNFERDPITVTLEGSNNASAQLSLGASWKLIYSGSTGIYASVDPGRMTYVAMQNFNNTLAYTSYRLLATSKRASSYGVQYSEVNIYSLV
ncbi:unnamed protein product [Adineta steineri]|uniref:Uncharacterized protein n=1 Tax=Adineta steineri TaxID=433720 RepID=A0A815I5S0_9BILA|nr:unnamed protein product [Adineta steineri]CAF3515786.1 unnamed protein product [Adineta steineri]